MTIIAIVDYGLANVRSVVNALECFTVDVRVAPRGEDLASADAIVLPGVGHFGAGMRALRERKHDQWLRRRAIDERKPLLGICLGMQFFFEDSEEGDERGLGWIPGRVVRFDRHLGIKVPHIGWSEVRPLSTRGLFSGIGAPTDFYFVHSFYAPLHGVPQTVTCAVAEYGLPFVAAVEQDNLWGTQFHPEKSQLGGMKLLETFVVMACRGAD